MSNQADHSAQRGVKPEARISVVIELQSYTSLIDGRTGSRPDQRTRRWLFVKGSGLVVKGSVKDFVFRKSLKRERM